MNWLLLMALLADNQAVKQQATATIETTTVPAPISQPDLELLLFLAEWQDSDTGEWLDPETFATDDSINQQLDTPKEQQHEKDPDSP